MSDTNEYLAHLGANLGEHDLANIMLEKINEDKRNKIKARNIWYLVVYYQHIFSLLSSYIYRDIIF